MSRSVQFIANNVPVNGPADGRSFPCLGISRKALSLPTWSSGSYYGMSSRTKFASLKCSSRVKFLVCRAGSGGYRRNPEYSRQNKFSRNRNRQNEDRGDGSESFEEPEVFSKNGPLLSMSSAPRFQATATPGPREREIVELFRKVQAQLRERAAVKEEKKREELPGQGKESETVDSLLKLLRKHTTQQEKKNSSTMLDLSKQNGAFGGDKGPTSLDSSDVGKDEAQEREPSSFNRPVSNFQRRSPVPRVKFRPFNSDSVTETYIRPKSDVLEDDAPETEDEAKLKIEPPLGFSDGFDEISEGDEASDDEDDYNDDAEKEVEEEEEEEEEDEEEPIAEIDYNAMKLVELRAVAKARGVKGFSKLKKLQLIELLSGGST